MHGGVNAPGVRGLARNTDLGGRASNRLCRIERLNSDPRVCLARGVRFGHGYRLRDPLHWTKIRETNTAVLTLG